MGYRLAIVECLQFCEFIAMLFEKVTEAPNEPRSLGRRDTGPRPALKGPACRCYGQVYIGFVARRHVCDRLFRRRVFDREGLAALRSNPLPTD
jgi:hypothetical protein